MKLDVVKIKFILAENGWSIVDCACRINMSPNQFGAILKRGRAMPKTVKRIADSLGCEITDILIL